MAETVDRPGILVGFDEAATIWGISQEIESELSVRFYRVDATEKEESRSCISAVIDARSPKNLPIEVIIHPVDVIRIHHCHCLCWDEIPLFADCDSFVLFSNTPVRRNTAPVSRLHLLSIPSHCMELRGGDTQWHARRLCVGCLSACLEFSQLCTSVRAGIPPYWLRSRSNLD